MSLGTTADPNDGHRDRPGILGGLAQRLQDGLRATIVALGQSDAQRLAAIVESSDDSILSVDLRDWPSSPIIVKAQKSGVGVGAICAAPP
jgi:hypothetical protein